LAYKKPSHSAHSHQTPTACKGESSKSSSSSRTCGVQKPFRTLRVESCQPSR
jgi:hypothetical protein